MLVEEKTMKTERIYDGRIINLRLDTIELPNKKYSKREIVEHPGSVGIVAFDQEDNIILVKQYRKPVEKFVIEIPAGRIDVNEEPRETARRELEEETGFTAGKLEYLFEFYPSPGITNEKVHLFLAQDLTEVINEEGDETYIEVMKLSLKDFNRLVLRGEILDSKTIIGFNAALKHLDKEGKL